METPNIPKPFTVEEIKNSPCAVLVAFLIGLILIGIGWKVNDDIRFNSKVNEKEKLIVELRSKAERLNDERIKMYEKIFFYERKINNIDSLIKSETEIDVNKILNEK